MKTYAYAKVNLFLNVKGDRPDGFHDLEMVNIMVGLADEIEITEIPEDKVVVDTSRPELNGRNNLAFKVATYLKKAYNIKTGVKIYITKNIPVGGGLGGGSSDAAATLRALNELWNLNLSDDELYKWSLKFGSDTPYCFYQYPAVVRGVGELIEPINIDISKYNISLYTPKVNVPTGQVFKNLCNSNKYSLDEAISYLQSGDYKTFVKGLKNDLQDTVFEMYPEIKNQYELLKKAYGEDGLFMSGSGSTIVRISEK